MQREAGVKRVLIPADNWQELFAKLDDIEVVPIRHVSEALRLAVVESRDHLLPVANQRP